MSARRIVTSALPCVLAICVFMNMAECRPQFGLLDVFGAGEIANGTSVLSALALAHLQHTVEKFLAFADLAQAALNATAVSGGVFG